MNRLCVGVVALTLGTFAGPARAGDGPRIAFAPGFPAAGPAKGEVVVRGAVRLPGGWAVVGPAHLAAWQNGGVVTSVSIPIDPVTGSWAGSIRGLTPARPYNFLVTATLTHATGEPGQYAIHGQCTIP